MDERAALSLLEAELADAGDDAAVVDGQVLTTDMLHETTDFPAGTTRYTAGWRAVGASLSDVAAMGAAATAAVAVYAAPNFDDGELVDFVSGARDVCDRVDATYVGGDLDHHEEFTVATTALGRVTDDGAGDDRSPSPVRRGGARPGDRVCVTGTLGRSAAALALFDRGEVDRANDLFRFEPRVAAGRALAPYASAMMDSSDGLARSLHQLGEASGCGFAIESDAIPVDERLCEVSDPGSTAATLDTALTFGEDFELVFAVPEADLAAAEAASPVDISVVGTAVADGITLDGEALPDEGYDHG